MVVYRTPTCGCCKSYEDYLRKHDFDVQSEVRDDLTPIRSQNGVPSEAASCHTVLVDGTFWTEDEMIRLGLSKKTAAEMGHLPQSGPGGMLAELQRLPPHVRKLLIHINNTNPILIEDSPERAQVERCGVEVAHDGMEIVF